MSTCIKKRIQLAKNVRYWEGDFHYIIGITLLVLFFLLFNESVIEQIFKENFLLYDLILKLMI